MSGVNAWLLNLGAGLHAAVGERELIHVLPDTPTLFEVPRAPRYCRKVLVWQGAVVPLMDLSMRLIASPLVMQETLGLVVVTAYQRQPDQAVRYGALLLNAPPVRIRVSDAQACNLPEPASAWRRLAVACFEQGDSGPVPVLDLGFVFSTP